MKKLLFSIIAVFGLLIFSAPLRAQVAGSIVSISALGGAQTSSLAGVTSGDYFSVRGSFTNLFAELRHADWGNSTASIHENGILAGADLSLFHIMVSAAVGVGSSKYQAPPYQYQPPPVNGVSTLPLFTKTPPSVTLTSFLYEAQAQYQFDIVAGLITISIGPNFIGETNSAEKEAGIGGVASVAVGL